MHGPIDSLYNGVFGHTISVLAELLMFSPAPALFDHLAKPELAQAFTLDRKVCVGGGDVCFKLC